MLPTRTPQLLKWLYPSLVWEMPTLERSVYLTFDDGPHPDITPWVLAELDKFGFKATFFCIGANVQKFPETYAEIIKQGHQTANHTFNHMKGFRTGNKNYFDNIEQCDVVVRRKLFRPPYGQIRSSQISFLKQQYRIIMWSLLAEDWNPKLDTEKKLGNLKSLTKPGDIVVFHDSEKALKNLQIILPRYLDFLKENQYECLVL